MKVKALGLCSGGLDSILAGVVLREQGIDVTWVAFVTPFFSSEKAEKASKMTGIPLIVKDITERYMPMLKNPPVGYGQHMNPCMDCHALMFQIAGEMMADTGADFLFSGEVLGQRPMSQTKSSMRYVEKHSGCGERILRPLSAKKMPVTAMEEKGLVDRQQLYDLSGRSRKPQMVLARQYGISEYPAPAGGCLLTDAGFSRRLKDLFDHGEDQSREALELLKHGRHIRLPEGPKVVVGRTKADNERILANYRPAFDIRIRMNKVPGPVALIAGGAEKEAVATAAAICAGYSKAPNDRPAEVQVMGPEGPSVMAVDPLDPDEVNGWLIS
ncbi:MAG: tRNA 4-thiouridine(8) synthase ThiI [Thermodesulfobacteriota bacterium]